MKLPGFVGGIHWFRASFGNVAGFCGLLYILVILMKSLVKLPRLLVLPLVLSSMVELCGCHKTQRRDFVVSSVTNLSHTYRATVLVREYFVEDKPSRSPNTYVILDPYSAAEDRENGADFKEDQVVMKPAECGPISVEWVEERLLKVKCEKCGVSLAYVGRHEERIGPVRIEYEGFPERSSWEGGR